MSSQLDRKPQIWKLAVDLGLKASDRPVQAIVDFVRTKVRGVAKKYHCQSLNDLLMAVAAEVGTVFEEVRSGADIERIKAKYLAKGEKVFANLEAELRSQDYAITLRRTRAQKWEAPFVSIIDCRGDKLFKLYFSKWHELAHLLTLTEQLRLVFRRTHADVAGADPEEQLMDVIAGELGFLKDFFASASANDISFATIERLRSEFCPTASYQAAMIGIVKALPIPCVLLEARLRTKKCDQGQQFLPGVAAVKAPEAQLRITNLTVNDAARNEGIYLFKQLRVPVRSVIFHIFEDGGYAEAIEEMNWWETSTSGNLEPKAVMVRARRCTHGVVALLLPIPSRRAEERRIALS